MELKPIAYMKSDLTTKFGIPRQGTLTDELKGQIVFEKEFSVAEAFRGILDYSHIYIIWGFSENEDAGWSPTVRPPRLGGNKRVGVFATRSPFRPNPIGLSIVKLISVEHSNGRVVLNVAGADLMDGTPIFDIKPYLPYVDSHPDATGGFAELRKEYALNVNVECDLASHFDQEQAAALIAILKQDPRPSYQNDPHRIYTFQYAGREVSFSVSDGTLYLLNVK